jgi:ABC-type transport system involved in multi-copper enzyme maturation permease subunit
MDSRIATIARCTLIEALRTRLAFLTLGAVIILLAASFFVESLAISEGARFQAGFYAAGMRFACVFLAGIHVLASVAREFNDKGLEVLLSLDLPRSHYILGKLAGFLAVAGLMAAIASLPVAWIAAPAPAAQWMISLGLELSIVVALALFCIVTFSQVIPAACFVLAFYLLARSLAAIRLISAHPIAGADSPFHQVMQFLFDVLALIMPSLDAWTRTAWLVNEQAPWPEILQLAGQSALYVALLAAAAMFDFYRKNF